MYTGEWAQEEDRSRDSQCHWTEPHPLSWKQQSGWAPGCRCLIFLKSTHTVLATSFPAPLLPQPLPTRLYRRVGMGKERFSGAGTHVTSLRTHAFTNPVWGGRE